MSIDELALRQLLGSVHWRGICENILDLVDSGDSVTIEMIDGTEITLTDREPALQLFRDRFGWTEEM